jgi:hypothetical protein
LSKLKRQSAPTARPDNWLPDLDVCEGVAGLAETWPGRCFEIACRLLDTGVDAHAVYGLYSGWVSPAGYYAGRAHIGHHRHGWLVLADGRVFDPTRWVFENVAPYLFVGFDERDEYDVEMRRLRRALGFDAEQCPPFAAGGPMTRPPANLGGDPVVLAFVGQHCPGALGGVVSFDQLHWLAHQDPAFLGEAARPLFEAIVRAGYQACIPLAARDEVLGRTRGS